MKAYLQRMNPDTMEIRFYSLQIQPDLLGRWTIIRNWGSSGSGGTIRHEPYECLEEALEGFDSHKNRLIKDGYRVVMQEGLKPSMAVKLGAHIDFDSDS